MTQTLPEVTKSDDLNAELLAHVRRYRAAAGPGLRLLNALGSRAENLIERVPAPVRDQLEGATKRGMELSFDAAAASRSRLRDGDDWFNTALTTAMGAAGGLGGLPSALAEVPVTVTVLMRAIQGIAEEHGFDPASEEVRMACLEVFAAAGPLSDDDGADMGFLTIRVALSGPGMRVMMARVTPIFAQVLGRKLAAQAVPVLGAVAGAATNYIYTAYYQDIARVRFGLMDIARRRGLDHDALVRTFKEMVREERIAAA
jgi:hypothetical protein